MEPRIRMIVRQTLSVVSIIDGHAHEIMRQQDDPHVRPMATLLYAEKFVRHYYHTLACAGRKPGDMLAAIHEFKEQPAEFTRMEPHQLSRTAADMLLSVGRIVTVGAGPARRLKESTDRYFYSGPLPPVDDLPRGTDEAGSPYSFVERMNQRFHETANWPAHAYFESFVQPFYLHLLLRGCTIRKLVDETLYLRHVIVGNAFAGWLTSRDDLQGDADVSVLTFPEEMSAMPRPFVTPRTPNVSVGQDRSMSLPFIAEPDEDTGEDDDYTRAVDSDKLQYQDEEMK